MIKRFTAIGLVLILLVTFAPPSLAAAKSFSSLTDLCAWLDEQQAARVTEFDFELTASVAQHWSVDDLDLMVYYMLNYLTDDYDGRIYHTGSGGLRWEIRNGEYRDGVRMYDAWKSGKRKGLNKEEKRCLKKAERIVEDISRENKSPINRELAVHDYLCEHMYYWCPDPVSEHKLFERSTTTASALMDGKGCCQAYAGTFFLLGQMLGLDVGFVCGRCVPTGGHIWNTVTVGGNTLMLDATFDDINAEESTLCTNMYAYFNFSLDRLSSQLRVWEESVPVPLSGTTDSRFTYYNDIEGYGLQARTIDEAARYCVQEGELGHDDVHFLIPDENIDTDLFDAAIDECITSALIANGYTGWAYNWAIDGGNTYFALHWN